MNFKIGQKIVCVEHFKGLYADDEKSNDPMPKIYHVYEFDGYHPLTHDYLYLSHIRTKNEYGLRPSYISKKFRPLDEVLSEISIEELTNIEIEA